MKNKLIAAAISPNPKTDAPKHAEGTNTGAQTSFSAPFVYEGRKLPHGRVQARPMVTSPPTIFKQNVKKNSKLRPFNEIISDVGDIQYFPA